MTDRFDRWSLLAGPLAVALWILGLIVAEGLTDSLADGASDQQVLAWVQDNTNMLLTGGWIFMVGCLAFVWFWAALRARLLAAEGAPGTLSALAFGGGLATAIFAMLTQAPDIAAAINQDSISAATAGTLHNASDAFFVCAELAAIIPLVAVGLLALRTAVLPKWWAWFGLLVAVVLVIGPIGWAALIFGVPIWTLGTTVIAMGSRSGRVKGTEPAVA